MSKLQMIEYLPGISNKNDCHEKSMEAVQLKNRVHSPKEIFFRMKRLNVIIFTSEAINSQVNSQNNKFNCNFVSDDTP